MGKFFSILADEIVQWSTAEIVGSPIDDGETPVFWKYLIGLQDKGFINYSMRIFVEISSADPMPQAPAPTDIVAAIEWIDPNGVLFARLEGLSITYNDLLNGGTQTLDTDRYPFWVSLLDGDVTVTGNNDNNLFLEVGADGDGNVAGGNGIDKLYVWHEKDVVFDGGDGDDTILFIAATGDPAQGTPTQQLVVNLGTGLGKNPYGGTLLVKNVENVIGTSGADLISGNSKANIIGDPFDTGADVVKAGSGNDIVQIGWGIDGGAKIDGGADKDELRFLVTDQTTNSDRIVLDIQTSSLNTFVFKGGTYTNLEVFTAQSFGGGGDTDVFVFGGSDAAETVAGTSVQAFVGPAFRPFVGRDELNGRGGSDVLKGLGGNDRLDGGIGADRLEGGQDDDTYIVDNVSDVIVELAGNGSADRVLARSSYTLATDVDVEQMATVSSTATAAINLTGNALKQEIIGNAGANTLSEGGAGVGDTLRGLGGNDSYRVYNSGAVIVESAAQGTLDRVLTSTNYKLGAGVHVEQLQTSSSTGTTTLSLLGNEIAQKIIGNAGTNLIDGKGGADTLQGGSGKDYFTFSTALGASNVDTITDFNVAADTIRLENTIFTAVNASGALLSGYFRANTAGTAQDSNDHIVYETDTGKLFYDADANGAGAAVQFAILAGNPAITAADFVVI